MHVRVAPSLLPPSPSRYRSLPRLCYPQGRPGPYQTPAATVRSTMPVKKVTPRNIIVRRPSTMPPREPSQIPTKPADEDHACAWIQPSSQGPHVVAALAAFLLDRIRGSCVQVQRHSVPALVPGGLGACRGALAGSLVLNRCCGIPGCGAGTAHRCARGGSECHVLSADIEHGGIARRVCCGGREAA